ncbi:interleukin-17F-like [Notothenia coriiceps]|uniref:Interleukin-17F-like n=1 Tax=Notothenia coriiceps TaxID=8208 RepID=A0A6I9PA48_9TELE|nr:PREDICTED: interleukin-17F-like [Notothenia coriiceps]
MASANNSSKVTLFCVVAMMMMMKMMMVEAAAMPKVGGQSKHPKTHTEASDGAEAEMIPLQIDNKFLNHYRSVRPLQNASVSPWTYNITNDATLVPPFLSEARCLLRGCLDLDGVEDLNLESRPIMHQVMMLRRVKSKGAETGYHYRLESRLLAVGCTCVRPTVQYQD